MSYVGLVGLPSLEYHRLSRSRLNHPISYLRGNTNARLQQSTAATNDDAEDSKRIDYQLPAFIRIFNFFLVHSQRDEVGSNNFITNVAAIHEVAFSPKCPILGTGHHFAVYASPFDSSEDNFTPQDGRAFNNEVYCMKAPNFATGGNTGPSSAKDMFRVEYYETALQELRVLLHPDLRTHENIISLFGLDFQEDYDDCNVAWPVLIMENAEYGTLDTLQQDIRLDPELSRTLLLDVARGIQALHQCNVIHGDIKSENVLICRHKSRPYVARLSDFGLSVINPDASNNKHRLPGGTFLWQAPEFNDDLSIEGLRQTDVYSFGLTVWRVLVNNPNPFSLIPPTALGLKAESPLSTAVSRAKEHSDFTRLVLQTLETAGVQQVYAMRLIEASLGNDPTCRDLSRMIWALDGGNIAPEFQSNETYWATQMPSLVMEQLEEAFPERILPYTLKPSMIRSLLADLETVFKCTGSPALSAGWLLFKFAASPQFQVAWKDVDQCCRILIKLCHMGSVLGQAIMVRYHEINGKRPAEMDPEWLEVAATNGSYYALESLREHFPENYLQLMENPLQIESCAENLDEHQAELINHCRKGDYDACKVLLETGASALPTEEGVVTALHWIVSFKEESQINDLVGLLLGNGALLDAWEGESDDLAFGRVCGTPLHWAVWHRNVSAVRALTIADVQPDAKQVEKALWTAAAMHYYDVLEILKDWALQLKNFPLSDINWYPSFLFAADQSFCWLPRRLRNDDNLSPLALERTMDIILDCYTPSAEDLKLIFACTIQHNQPALLRYLYSRSYLNKRNELLLDTNTDPAFRAIAMGFFEIMEIFVEMGHINAHSKHGVEKWAPLQLCCLTRQRDSKFLKRLLEIGCAVDGVGGAEESGWTPFFIAVSWGMYKIAVMLLEHGADKDSLSGWMGGLTVTMNLLVNWPDIPLSRVKFLLDEVPRLGFGHVTFWGWPGAGGNLIYALSLHHWSSYTSGYRLAQTAKYILSQLEDKSCLNMIDKIGATALRMACACGNVEIIKELLDNGQDPNLALGFSPLANAKNWLATCQKREKEALKGKPGSERRLARQLRERAEETMTLLKSHGAVDRGFLEAMSNSLGHLGSGQLQMPSLETALELFSGFFDPPRVNAGTTPLQPTRRAEFTVHHGVKGAAQLFLGGMGRAIDRARASSTPKPTIRYQPHNCLPWRNDNCLSRSQSPNIPNSSAPRAFSFTPQQSTHTASSSRALLNSTSYNMPGRLPTHDPSLPLIQIPNVSPVNQRQLAISAPSTTSNHVTDHNFQAPQRQATNPSPTPLRTAAAVQEKLFHSLLHYFCEGGGEQADATQKRDRTVEILQTELRAPIVLGTAQLDAEACGEFLRINEAVKNTLEMMQISDIRLVPELSDSGCELVIDVFS